MLKVLVCDDELARAHRLRDDIERAVPQNLDVRCIAVTPGDFASAIVELERRRRDAREAGEGSSSALPFDDADIIFLDYDLVRLADEDAGVTGSESGERIAYLARCYSSCGLIVGYNQFYYEKTFDLTLRGNLRSFADLNISYDVVTHPGLWSDAYDGFRPWYWPLLPQAVMRMRRCVDQLADRIDEPILSLLGLTIKPTYDAFSREQLEFLGPSREPELATFRNFVTESGQGLKPKDKLWESAAAARIGASRISKWLERSVLPGQNILVDAPHLIERFPSLLIRDEFDKNVVCRLEPEISDLGIESHKISGAQFNASSWVSRPAWLWPVVSLDEGITEVRDPWSYTDDSLVFCEDASRFLDRQDSQEFVAEVQPEFGRRHVRKFDGVRYEPAVRFLM